MALPRDDTFDALTPAYDNTLLVGGYVRFLGYTTNPLYAGGGTALIVLPEWTKFGRLYSGHWPVSNTQFANDVVNLAPARGFVRPAVNTSGAHFGANVGASLLTGWCLRDYVAAEVEVACTYTMRHMPGPDWVSAIGFDVMLGARLSAGTLTDGGLETAHLLNGDGYYLHVQVNSSGGQKLYLTRVNGGTVTRLADSPAGAPATNFIPWATWNAGNRAKTLRLTVHTNGGQVELRAYVTNVGAEQLVLSYNDTSGSRITASGRCGFVGPNEWIQGSGAHGVAFQSFRVSTYGGTLIAYDDFARLSVNAAAVVTRTFTSGTYAGWSVDGRDLVSTWYGDLRGVAGFASRLLKSVDRLKLSSAAADMTGFYMSQRYANDIRTQDRKVKFELENTAPGVIGLVRGVGVVVRCGNVLAGGVPVSAYVFEARYDQDAATALYTLTRYTNGVAVLLASKVATGAVVPGIEYEIELQVDTIALPDPINGYARLRAYKASVQVQLLPLSPTLPGINVLADGTVVDTTSARIRTGPGEGFYVRSKNLATAGVFVNAWGTGSFNPPATGESTEASIPVPAENAGATGTFPAPYCWGAGEDEELPVIDHVLEGDHRYLSPMVELRRRAWTIGCPESAKAAEIQLLQAFFDDRAGSEIPFTLTSPRGTTVTVRFVADTFVWSVAGKKYTWQAQVEEVHDGT